MKKTLLWSVPLLCSALLLTSPVAAVEADASCTGQLKTLAKSLHPKHKLSEELSTCKVWPYSADKTIMVIMLADPTQNDPYDQTWDIDVVVTDTTSGKVVARNHTLRAIQDNAVFTSQVTIDTARYQLTPGLRAFGVRFTHRGSSRVNPFNIESLSLYAMRDQALPMVLNHFIMNETGGEWDGNCAGTLSEKKRTLSVLKSSRHGFADLKVQSKTSESISKVDARGECQIKETSNKQTDLILRYDGKRYPIGKDNRFDNAP